MNKVSLLFNRNAGRWVLGIVILVITSGSAFGVWTMMGKSSPTNQVIYQTAVIKTGNIAITAFGTGQLVAGKIVDLSFPTAGEVDVLNVGIGDHVSKGDILAVQTGVARLQLDVKDKEVALQKAQKTLDDLLASSSNNLAHALADQAAAQAAYHTALFNLHQKGDPRCEASVTEAYQYDYLDAQGDIRKWEGIMQSRNLYGSDFIKKQLADLEKKSNTAWNNWKWCEDYTDLEILESQANLQLAKANKEAAEKKYQDLKANSGIDPEELKIAEANVENARQQLSSSRTNLEGATMIAPIDGTVTKVNGSAGTRVDTSIFITLADLDHPRFEVYVDETDALKFSVNCPAEVTFDTIKNKTFAGIVTGVTPKLISVKNVNMVQGVVELKDVESTRVKNLKIGQNMAIDVTCKQANNVVLAPIEAYHPLTGNSGYVYTLDENNTPVKRNVTIGLKTTAFVEVSSGLKEGEKVITSQIN